MQEPQADDVTTCEVVVEGPEVHAGTLVVHGKPTNQEAAEHLSAKELVALGNIKSFCAGLLKKLAPPLLKEIVGARGVRPGQDPFTPRRTTHSVRAGGEGNMP